MLGVLAKQTVSELPGGYQPTEGPDQIAVVGHAKPVHLSGLAGLKLEDGIETSSHERRLPADESKSQLRLATTAW